MKDFPLYTVHPKERLYYAIMIIVSLMCYAWLLYYFVRGGMAGYVLGLYAVIGIIVNFLLHAYFIGFIRGNGVKVHEAQFPEIYDIFKGEAEKLGFQKMPTLWLLQGGGMLNAFATRFGGRSYVVMYSDVVQAAYEEGRPAVEFVLGHELGHLKRNHVGFFNSFLILPARFIPFLGSAYSRACEYTCDRIGYALAPEGAEMGITILAAGRSLYKKVQVQEFVAQINSEKGFTTWFAEIFSSHPLLVKRIAQFQAPTK
jgi:Zn-dependent protease with chaperone function